MHAVVLIGVPEGGTEFALEATRECVEFFGTVEGDASATTLFLDDDRFVLGHGGSHSAVRAAGYDPTSTDYADRGQTWGC